MPLTGIVVCAVVSGGVIAESELRFNPFEQPNIEAELTDSENKTGNELKLRGTLIDGDDSLVNIGGEFYRLNQEVSGYRVLRIDSGKVTLRRGVNETVLTLKDDD